MDEGRRVVGAAQVLAERDDLRAVVFVEGASDHAALAALAVRQGRDLDAEGIAVAPMEGFSGIGRFLALFGPAGRDLRLAGLCDEAEAWYVGGRLAGAGVDDATFHVCHPDLEGELLRAVGPDGAVGVLDAMGDAAGFRRFQRQPAQRERPLAAQLHRFLGTRSGRKVVAARALVDALPLDRVPGPLLAVLADARRDGPGP
ncbi:TOPRIM nucleotidyl transferase/hydrolase domain-containing protein [Iamia sp. SCSIO 61187]|uniref:TOPRIM nucleotidyl transferase/hydrolase domain-containing protein n=1 Tax=Iamia sp. SCSIO 61187 TaxID=2722752 RepID=UPI001C6315CA|nr:TOPRIM nucleotidyl transferase/hydrolase domain-containing protein [Iamia sp. SCSIO 61187]